MSQAACMNAVRNPSGGWYRCEWSGEIESLDAECPRCLNKGRLAPVVEIGGDDESDSAPESGGVRSQNDSEGAANEGGSNG